MGFKPRKIKFKVYDICHQKSHIVGTDRHDGLDTLDMSDNEVFHEKRSRVLYKGNRSKYFII